MKTIEEFIEDFRTKQNDYIPTENNDAEEIIRHQFRAGYCYYFAKILQIAYPNGKVCLAYPFGHFVYEYENKYYDIEGENQGEDVEYFIPESFINKDMLGDFLHNGTEHNTFKEEIEMIKNKWEKHLLEIKKSTNNINNFFKEK